MPAGWRQVGNAQAAAPRLGSGCSGLLCPLVRPRRTLAAQLGRPGLKRAEPLRSPCQEATGRAGRTQQCAGCPSLCHASFPPGLLLSRPSPRFADAPTNVKRQLDALASQLGQLSLCVQQQQQLAHAAVQSAKEARQVGQAPLHCCTGHFHRATSSSLPFDLLPGSWRDP